jgi:hypothetical protein
MVELLDEKDDLSMSDLLDGVDAVLPLGNAEARTKRNDSVLGGESHRFTQMGCLQTGSWSQGGFGTGTAGYKQQERVPGQHAVVRQEEERISRVGYERG